MLSSISLSLDSSASSIFKLSLSNISSKFSLSSLKSFSSISLSFSSKVSSITLLSKSPKSDKWEISLIPKSLEIFLSFVLLLSLISGKLSGKGKSSKIGNLFESLSSKLFSSKFKSFISLEIFSSSFSSPRLSGKPKSSKLLNILSSSSNPKSLGKPKSSISLSFIILSSSFDNKLSISSIEGKSLSSVGLEFSIYSFVKTDLKAS